LAGDQKALGALLAERRKTVRNVARRHLRNETEIEECVGRTELEIIKCFASFRGRDALQFTAWLRTITQRCAIAIGQERFYLIDDADTRRESSELPSHEPYVVDKQTLSAALQQIPFDFAEALALHHAGWTYKDIATRQTVSVTTVGTRILRAKKALYHLIQEQS
jgi:RNA polymerase sigma factor (sigma-70 family)